MWENIGSIFESAWNCFFGTTHILDNPLQSLTPRDETDTDNAGSSGGSSRDGSSGGNDNYIQWNINAMDTYYALQDALFRNLTGEDNRETSNNGDGGSGGGGGSVGITVSVGQNAIPIPKPSSISMPNSGVIPILYEFLGSLDKKAKSTIRKIRSGQIRKIYNKDGIFGYFTLCQGEEDVGWVGTVPDLDGKTIEEIDDILLFGGWNKNISGQDKKPDGSPDDNDKGEGKNITYKNVHDNSKITIKSNGEIVRSTKSRYDPIFNNNRINKGEKLIKNEEGEFIGTRSQEIIHEMREKGIGEFLKK